MEVCQYRLLQFVVNDKHNATVNCTVAGWNFGGFGWEFITCWMELDDETDDQIRPEYVRQQSHTSL